MNGLVSQSGAQRRLANSFRGTGRDTKPPTREATDRIINFHISTINAMLRAKGKPELSPADYGRIHAAAEGSSSTSSESIMQAVLSAATAALPNDAQTSFKKMLDEKGIDEAAYYNAIAKYGAGLGSFDAIINAARGIRNGSSAWEASQASYSSVAVASFSSNNGVLSGMTPTLYREHFQTYYGATPQGQFTATRVANVLATNEGLTGAALVARTKEVGHDTGVRLGLDTNRYAPKVANIGKKYSEPAITYKEMLDKAIELQKQGNQAAADEMSRQAEALRKQQEEKAKIEDPKKAPDVGAVYQGVTINALKQGWKPPEWKDAVASLVNPDDPDARAKLAEIGKTLSETPAGREAAAKFQLIAEKEIKDAEARKKAETANLAVTSAIASKLDEGDALFDAPRGNGAIKEPVGSAPIVKAEVDPKKGQPVQDVKTDPKKDEPKKLVVATNGRAVGPV